MLSRARAVAVAIKNTSIVRAATMTIVANITIENANVRAETMMKMKGDVMKNLTIGPDDRNATGSQQSPLDHER